MDSQFKLGHYPQTKGTEIAEVFRCDRSRVARYLRERKFGQGEPP
jgi:hypothetical protein